MHRRSHDISQNTDHILLIVLPKHFILVITIICILSYLVETVGQNEVDPLCQIIFRAKPVLLRQISEVDVVKKRTEVLSLMSVLMIIFPFSVRIDDAVGSNSFTTSLSFMSRAIVPALVLGGVVVGFLFFTIVYANIVLLLLENECLIPTS